MGRASRHTWAKRREGLLGLPGSLGTMIRSLLLFGKPSHGRARKDIALRGAWWLRDQHLKGGKFQKQFSHTVTKIDQETKEVTINTEPAYPQFPSIAAMLEHFKEEQEQPRKDA